MPRILGVDPGALGALALIVDGILTDVVDMPMLRVRRGKTDKAEVDGYTLADILRKMAPDVAYVEQVGGLPGQSASAAFNFGRAAGAVEYTLKTLGVRVEMIAPASWKKSMKLNGGKDDSRAMAMRLWPASAADFKRKMDNDRAEAALIAEYGRKQQPTTGAANVFD